MKGWGSASAAASTPRAPAGIADAHKVVECPTDRALPANLRRRRDGAVDKDAARKPRHLPPDQSPVSRRKACNALEQSLPEICRQCGDNPHHYDPAVVAIIRIPCQFRLQER
jgi:hypothetical protein